MGEPFEAPPAAALSAVLDPSVTVPNNSTVPSDIPTGRAKSASTAEANAQDLARIRRMTVRERMLLALELGRRGRAFQQRVKKARESDESSCSS